MDEQQNLEKEGQQAAQQVLPPQKKPGRAALQIFAIAVLLGLVGYGVYVWQNNRVTQLEDQVADLKKSSSTSATATTADPYKGWKTYTTKYEKLTFKYPSTFALSDTSTAADSNEGLNSDRITLTASNGLNMVMQTGLWGVGGGCDSCTNELSEKVQVLGSDYYINYVNNGQKKGNVTSALLASNKDAYMDFLKAKTIMNGDGSPSLMSFSFSYQKNGTDTQVVKSLATYTSDSGVSEIKKILQSLSY